VGVGDFAQGLLLGGASGGTLGLFSGGAGGLEGFAFELVVEELEVVVVALDALALVNEIANGGLAGVAVGGRVGRRRGRDVGTGADDGGKSEAGIARVLCEAGLGIGEESLHGLKLHLREEPGVLGGLYREGGHQAAAVDSLLKGWGGEVGRACA
jgi:hypothetical protein